MSYRMGFSMQNILILFITLLLPQFALASSDPYTDLPKTEDDKLVSDDQTSQHDGQDEDIDEEIYQKILERVKKRREEEAKNQLKSMLKDPKQWDLLEDEPDENDSNKSSKKYFWLRQVAGLAAVSVSLGALVWGIKSFDAKVESEITNLRKTLLKGKQLTKDDFEKNFDEEKGTINELALKIIIAENRATVDDLTFDKIDEHLKAKGYGPKFRELILDKAFWPDPETEKNMYNDFNERHNALLKRISDAKKAARWNKFKGVFKTIWDYIYRK